MSHLRADRKRWIAFLPAVLVAGCATGFDRGAIRERLAGERVEVDDAEVQRALQLRPQVRFPIRVAAFLNAAAMERPGQAHPAGRSVEAGWRFTVRDEETIASWAEPLRARGIVSDLFVVSDLVKTGQGLREARLAAARCGAEAVLFIQAVSQVDARVNPLSVLNVLFFPGFFVPASHRDALLVMKGALYDVGNKYLYLTVQPEKAAEFKELMQAVDPGKRWSR